VWLYRVLKVNGGVARLDAEVDEVCLVWIGMVVVLVAVLVPKGGAVLTSSARCSSYDLATVSTDCILRLRWWRA
jgi:hypothetical protein